MELSDKNQNTASGGFAVEKSDRNDPKVYAMFIPSIMERNLI